MADYAMSNQGSNESQGVFPDTLATMAATPPAGMLSTRLAGLQSHVRLLDSVAQFTHHRDIDALDHSLVLSLAELTSARSVSLAKRGQEGWGKFLQDVIKCQRNEVGAYEVSVAEPEPGDELLAPLWRCMDHPESLQHTDWGGGEVLVPILCNGKVLGALQLDSDVPEQSARTLMVGFARIYANYTDLLHESERDKLTGLYNRRTFERHLERLLQQAESMVHPRAVIERRSQHGASRIWLAMMDIDHFKSINDQFGHLYGDEVILLLAQQMRRSFRQDDVLFRFGGEEFVVLLNADDEATVCGALERFRKHVAEHVFPQAMHVTVSIGYAHFGTGAYQQTVLDHADKALYYAKEHGRNATFGYESLVAQALLGEAVASGSIDLF